VKQLEAIMRNEILVGIPDFRGFAAQGNLFGGFGGGRDIAVHMQSADEAGLIAASESGQAQLMELFPGANVQAFRRRNWPSPNCASTRTTRAFPKSDGIARPSPR
jgi:hypothetical protein